MFYSSLLGRDKEIWNLFLQPTIGTIRASLQKLVSKTANYLSIYQSILSSKVKLPQHLLYRLSYKNQPFKNAVSKKM